jgi:hypothetical protein
MPAPNVGNQQPIYLKSTDPVLLSVSMASPTSILANAAASGKAIKVNAIRFAANDDASVNHKGGLLLKKNGGAAELIGFHIIAARSAQLMMAKNEVIYLEENDELLGFCPSGSTSTVTISNASPGVISWTAHALVANRTVVFTTTGALPTGLVVGTTYYVKDVLTANTFNVSATPGGAAINTSSAGSGTHTATASGLVGFVSSYEVIG